MAGLLDLGTRMAHEMPVLEAFVDGATPAKRLRLPAQEIESLTARFAKPPKLRKKTENEGTVAPPLEMQCFPNYAAPPKKARLPIMMGGEYRDPRNLTVVVPAPPTDLCHPTSRVMLQPLEHQWQLPFMSEGAPPANCAFTELPPDLLEEPTPSAKWSNRVGNMRKMFRSYNFSETYCIWEPSINPQPFEISTEKSGWTRRELNEFEARGYDEQFELMMFASGDETTTGRSSAVQFVQQFVMTQMNILLQKLFLLAKERHAKAAGIQPLSIGYEDLITVCAGNLPRLHRYVQFVLREDKLKKSRTLRQLEKDNPNFRNDYKKYLFQSLTVSDSEDFSLENRCPHIYSSIDKVCSSVMTHIVVSQSKSFVNLRRSLRIRRLKKRNEELSKKGRSLFAEFKDISFCSRRNSRSTFRALRFHELIGLPPLETDLIYHLDHFAMEIIRELVYEALLVRDKKLLAAGITTNVHEPLCLQDYVEAKQKLLRAAGENYRTESFLFNNLSEKIDTYYEWTVGDESNVELRMKTRQFEDVNGEEIAQSDVEIGLPRNSEFIDDVMTALRAFGQHLQREEAARKSNSP
ncbi:unnamed protein product [Caenorhabditis auriculariae]|uniref:Uncharacterized protein n=1 Tax=Caenorhabditis auriculariae TaxID=2777116 RepID=A0A8S1GSB9_9PELO|nr:unnamed protein product [Caenorhabditis auriculariae]